MKKPMPTKVKDSVILLLIMLLIMVAGSSLFTIFFIFILGVNGWVFLPITIITQVILLFTDAKNQQHVKNVWEWYQKPGSKCILDD